MLANDVDAQGNTFSITSVSGATNGSATLLGTGDVEFTPSCGVVGMGSFVYTITDQFGATDTATVDVELTNSAPVAVNDSDTTPEDTAIAVSVLGNDSDPEDDTLSLIHI